MDIRLIKKSEKILMEKMKMMEEAEEENLQAASVHLPDSVVEEPSNLSIAAPTPSYIPQQDYPLVQSVCNSGWQVSDIWRDIRLDNFCNY